METLYNPELGIPGITGPGSSKCKSRAAESIQI
jgi:hypothetical protein